MLYGIEDTGEEDGVRILLAGETWQTMTTVVNGANAFPGRTTETDSATALTTALTEKGFVVDRVPSARIASGFPESTSALMRYDAIMIGDVGADSFTLTPALYDSGSPQPERLKAVCEYVQDGGGLVMIGGYLSYSGISGLAGFGRTPLAAILPVTMLDGDDRVERPGGATPTVALTAHPILHDVEPTWPPILGYNRLTAKPGTDVPLIVDDCPLLVLGTHGHGRIVAFASDCAPHWASHSFLAWNSYSTFFTNVVTWVAGTRNSRGY